MNKPGITNAIRRKTKSNLPSIRVKFGLVKDPPKLDFADVQIDLGRRKSTPVQKQRKPSVDSPYLPVTRFDAPRLANQ